jgi:hypothetical protein
MHEREQKIILFYKNSTGLASQLQEVEFFLHTLMSVRTASNVYKTSCNGKAFGTILSWY